MILEIKRFIFKILVTIKYYKIQKATKDDVLALKGENLNGKNDKAYLQMKVTDVWKNVFKEYNRFKPKEVKIMLEYFINDNVYLVKKSYGKSIPYNEPILICNVKNDLERLKVLIEHHKKIGVKYFAILDNMSTDGTYEWLQTQAVDVFRVEEQYTSVIRAIWIMKIASYYGFNRWFITIDSDELLVYDGYENKKIQDVVTLFEKKGIDRGLGFMIDMYAESSELKKTNSKRNIFETYTFFDSSGYEKKDGILGVKIKGGPRARHFNESALMTKYPLFFWHEGEINRYHYIFPMKKVNNEKCYFGLLHYKFIDGDYEKIKKIVEDGNYASGSALYKNYLNLIDASGEISFIYEGSRKFNNSHDLLKIDLISSLWE